MNADMIAANKEAGQVLKPAKPTPVAKERKPMRRARVRPVSDKQALKDARWRGVKDGILTTMRRYEIDGKAHCESCGVVVTDATCDLHHLRSRAQGGSYEARNAAVLCRPCHRRETGEPQWSKP